MVSPSARIQFLLNDQDITSDIPPSLPVLDWLRRQQRLTGVKEGCKEGDCGACTVLIGQLTSRGLTYHPVTSCLVPMGELQGKHLVTIEGLNLPPGELTPLQQTLVKEGGTQCGYCTPGIVVSMTHALMTHRSRAGLTSMKDALSGHLCRCTGYASLKRAALRLGCSCPEASTLEEALPLLVNHRILPEYFVAIPNRLRALPPSPPTRPDPGARRVAGGTDLYVQHGDDLIHDRVELLNAYPEMNDILEESDHLLLGALTSFETFRLVPQIRKAIPRIDHYMHLVASLQIRHRATLGGNVVNASPIGDLTLLLLALDAEVCLRTADQERTLPLHELYLGYKELALREDEIVVAFRIPYPLDNARIHFEKVSKRTCLDIASVNSAIKLCLSGTTIRSATLSMGGVAPIPLRLAEAGDWLAGQSITTQLVRELQDHVAEAITPIDDVRGSADYKRRLARRLIAAHFIELFPDRVDAEAFV